MRFICNQDVFIFVKHALGERDGFFIFQLAVIKDAGPSLISSRWINAAPCFIDHLTLRHPGSPSFDVHVRVLLLEKVYDGFPRTCGKPLAARTNSFDDGKRRVQGILLKSAM